MPDVEELGAEETPSWPRLRQVLGPGLITGASDDDPSGIATYSQAGAQYGYALGWAMLLTYPLMCAIQVISAQIGRVTGLGLAGNLRRFMPRRALHLIVLLLLLANTINIGADLGAMAAAVRLLVPVPMPVGIAAFAIVSVLLEVFVRYARYVAVLKWLTLSLFAYVATVFIADVPWKQVGVELVLPHIQFTSDYFTVVVAVFGTTISPYLFFWQAGEEMEDERGDPVAKPLIEAPEQAGRELRRIRLDTYIGMAFSNVISLAIIFTTAATLHVHGITNIQTSSDAAEALRPIAGPLAFTVFALGIIGTGLLALPVLAGSAAYALCEAFGWPVGLAYQAPRAKAFYGTIAVAVFVGALLNFSSLDPVKALFWSAVINGLVAVPLMAVTVLLAASPRIMGQFSIGPRLKMLGWLGTLVMLVAGIGMFVTM
ncbi:NRAMP family divalent metal transporter [Acidocella aromatica]|uniref:NRAMP (Natural resistance-associated macrophage protein)-like metal ion transporter n=1 Tax=Acidocella aromatica TaxID=1303579 RepID=A0A840VJQ8_9PROT|nr:divalent metal cation transporter [Acidocella aromatica]MBB5372489.1 NRAMP (natural resistance-associated macrophage protein)-like metal ion transporter [Acidocella aromatica]